MFFKNDLRPAFATADLGNSAGREHRGIKDLLTRSQQDSQNDFGSFGEPAPKAERPRAERRPNGAGTQSSRPSTKEDHGGNRARGGKQNRGKGGNGFPWMYAGIAAIAIIAVVAIAVIIFAIFNAPGKNIKLEDNAYFSYTDADGTYRVVSNGKLIKDTFVGEIEIVPASDNSFAYVFEQATDSENSGYNMYILKGDKLKAIEADADSIKAIAAYAPGIVYERNDRFHYFSEDDHTPITGDSSADNFVISGNADVVVYTVSSSKDSEQTELKYFCNGASTTVGPNSFVPVEISNDGKYVYGLFKASLCYLKVEKEGEKVSQELIAGSSFGTFGAITGMNVDGDEIVFYTETVENEVSSYTSYMYTVGSEVVQIASGKFYPTPSASEIACPESFVNTYFVCESTEYDEENDRNALSYSTYFLDKKNGALRIADTRGKFSPDGDYFYYVNEDYELYRVSLKNTDFQKNTETVFNGVADFEIIKNGDVYIMFEDSKDLGYIFYWDSATKKRSTVSKDADLDSMQLCGSSIYFSETGEDDVTKIYVSTQGSAKEEAGFKGHTPAEALTVRSDVGSKGYAYFVDDNGSGCLYYTSNGKKFSLVASPCIIDGFNDVETDDTTNSTEGSDATDNSTATEE